MTRADIISYCVNEYNAVVDHPFKHYPHYAAIRHPNGKWFALVLDVPADRIGLDGHEVVDIVDLKVDPELNAILQEQPGFLPGYHMNKTHWISAVLPDWNTVDQLADLIEGSFNATK